MDYHNKSSYIITQYEKLSHSFFIFGIKLFKLLKVCESSSEISSANSPLALGFMNKVTKKCLFFLK